MAPTAPRLEALLAEVDWLRGLARHLAGADGDDVAQEALLVAQRAPLDPARPLRPWLAQVARHLTSVSRRTDRRRRQRESAYATEATSQPVDQAYERLELDRFLAARVMALDEPLRTVVVLRYYEGLDSPRIAALTGVAAGTVRWRLQRAMERLRADLDQQHGNRRAWSALILPALSPNRTTGTGALIMSTASVSKNWFALVILLLVLLGGGVGGWRLWAGRAADATKGSVADRGRLAGDDPSTGAGAASGRPGPPRLIAAADGQTDPEGTLEGCQDALAGALREANLRDEEARAVVPQVAFELGAPNHRLRAHIQPQVDRIMKDAGSAQGLVQDVECRSWACRITLVVTAVESNEVEPRLQAMQQWVPRVQQLMGLRMGPTDERPTFSFGARRSNRDPLTHRTLEEYVFFVGLPPASPEDTGGVTWGLRTPPTLEGCTRGLAVVRQRITSRHALLFAQRPPEATFAMSPRLARLPEGLQEAVTRALGVAGARLECRDAVCRLPQEVLSVSGQAALDRLNQEPALQGLLLMQEIAPRYIYFTVAAATIESLLSRVRAPLRDPEFFSACADPPQEGNLLVRLIIPATGENNEDDVPERMSVKLVAGTLAEAPSATCFMARYRQLLGNQRLPAPIGNLLRYESWVWRPGEPPKMVTPPPL
jgi:RNA polymerase sigma factor (sigma-70 family)